MNILRIVARPMLAAVFISDGIDAIRHTDDHVEKFDKIRPALEKLGVPPVLASDAKALARITGLISVGAGAGLATGVGARSCAVILALVNLPLTLINHPIWSRQERNRDSWPGFLRGAAVAGGLFFAILDRQDLPSWSWRRRNQREHKAALAALRKELTQSLEGKP